ncbi:MAG: sulfite exporter TauE/SafE family protein [Salinispira sp.]
MIIEVLIWGFIVGVCVGFTAIGTGILGGPGLIVLFGMDPVIAVGTISLAAIPMRATSVLRHARAGNIDWNSAALFSLTALPAAYFTARHALAIHSIIELKYIIAAAIFISIPLLIYRYRKLDKEKNGQLEQPEQPVESEADRKTPQYILPVAGGILGAVIGVTGITGILTIIAFLLIFRLESEVAVGTTSLVGFLALLIAGFAHFQAQNYNLTVFISLLPGVILGSYLGSALVTKVPRNVLRYTILAIIILSGVIIMVR